jgi:Holliday junction resolvase-like predicted endonuclease
MDSQRAPRILQHGAPPIKEADILRQARDYLRLKGWLVYRMQQGLGAHRGFPDLVAVKAGQVLFVEVKTRTGRLSQHQEAFRDEIEGQGLRYIVVRSVEDIIAAVKA